MCDYSEAFQPDDNFILVKLKDGYLYDYFTNELYHHCKASSLSTGEELNENYSIYTNCYTDTHYIVKK
jgi:hypothetical protein